MCSTLCTSELAVLEAATGSGDARRLSYFPRLATQTQKPFLISKTFLVYADLKTFSDLNNFLSLAKSVGLGWHKNFSADLKILSKTLPVWLTQKLLQISKTFLVCRLKIFSDLKNFPRLLTQKLVSFLNTHQHWKLIFNISKLTKVYNTIPGHWGTFLALILMSCFQYFQYEPILFFKARSKLLWAKWPNPADIWKVR